MERLMLLDGYGLVYRGYFALPPLTTSKGELVNGVFGFASIVLRGIAGPPARLPRGLVRPPGPDLPPRAVRRVQGHPRSACPTTCATSSRRSARSSRRCASRSTRWPATRPTTSSARSPRSSTRTRTSRRRSSPSTSTCSSSSRPRVRLMTTRSGVENTIMYDVARIDERFGLRARPDDRLQGAQGRPDRQHPGRARGRREDRRQAHPRVRRPRGALRAGSTRSSPSKLRDKLRRAPRPDPMGKRPLDDRARPAGRVRPRGRPARRLRPRHGRPAVPRVRVPDAHRAPAADGRRDRPRSARESLRSRRRRAATCPAARVAGAARRAGDPAATDAARPDERRAPAPARLRRRRRRRPAASADGPAPTTTPTGGTPDARRSTPADDLPTALAAAIVDPGRIEVRGRGPDRRRSSRGSRPSRRSASRCSLDDPRPRRGTPLALAVAGTDGRVGRGRGRRGAPTPCAACSSGSATPLVGHEVKPLLVARLRRRPGRRPRRRSPSTPRSRRTSSTPRCAARPSPTSSPSTSTRSCRRPPSCRPTARAGLEALSAIAVREPLERRLDGDQASTGSSARSSCRSSRSSPGWRRSASRSTSRRCGVLDREFGAEITRLEQEIYVDVGHEFNLGSPKQLEQILFFELNLPKGKRTKTGYSTDASVLEDLRPAHPMIDKLLEWRVYTKLRSTYVEALPTLMAADGRLHTTFHQAVAATGRLSSSDPNLQNIPIRTELGRRDPARVRGRRAATSSLLAADYSPDRAAHPRPRVGRRAPQGRLRAPGRHPPRDRRAGAPQGTRRDHPRTSGRWPRWSTSGSPTG